MKKKTYLKILNKNNQELNQAFIVYMANKSECFLMFVKIFESITVNVRFGYDLSR